VDHLLRPRDVRLLRLDRGRDLGRVGAPVARDERDDGAPVAEQQQRLDDLRRLAADRLGGR
jgi:hypothetical protein